MGSRMFASVTDEKCPYGCIYCFVDSAQYKKGINIKDKKRLLNSLMNAISFSRLVIRSY